MAAMDRIEVVSGDITRQHVDAIVNAANTSLLGGGGVDGTIHRAAGPELALECRMLHGCKTGQAKITGGYRLPAKKIIHTVGPYWSSGNNREDELLANCYRNSLALAAKNDIHTIAFPAISTGIYRFPLERATEIALRETLAFLVTDVTIEKVVFVCFDERTLQAYRETLQRLLNAI